MTVVFLVWQGPWGNACGGELHQPHQTTTCKYNHYPRKLQAYKPNICANLEGRNVKLNWQDWHAFGTLFGHCGAEGPKSPRDTSGDTPGTLRARRARQTPVAGRGGSLVNLAFSLVFPRFQGVRQVEKILGSLGVALGKTKNQGKEGQEGGGGHTFAKVSR